MSKELKNSEASLITNEQVAKAAMELLASGKTLDKVEMSRGLRARVREFLARAAGLRDSDISVIAKREDIIERLGLGGQYDERADHLIELVQKGIFVGHSPMPGREKVLDSFSAQDLETAATFQNPTLLLMPETSFEAKVAALNATKTMNYQQDAYVDDIFKYPAKASEKIMGWRAVIVDGARDLEVRGGDDLIRRLDKRATARRSARKPGERGFDRHLYAMLMLEALRKGEPIDRKTFTLLDNDQALSDSLVPSAQWDNGYFRVRFDWRYRERVERGGGNARLRSSVGGIVKL